MKIIFHRKFKKQLEKLPTELQEKVRTTIFKFSQNPLDKNLRNHSLSGKYKGCRAVSVTGDVRIIFIEEGGYLIVAMIRVGTHNQVYD